MCTRTPTGNPLACAAALVVLEEVPALLDRVQAAGERFEAAGWRGAGLMRARRGDAWEALRRGVIVIPAGVDGSLISATPPLTITDDEIDEALGRLDGGSAGRRANRREQDLQVGKRLAVLVPVREPHRPRRVDDELAGKQPGAVDDRTSR